MYELYDKMTYEEFVGWLAFFSQRPIDWRADLRSFKQLQAWGAKGKPEDYFPSLKPIIHPEKPEREDGKIKLEDINKSLLFMKMLSAKGGDKLDFLSETGEDKNTT